MRAFGAYAFAVQDKLERIGFNRSLFTQPCGIRAQGTTGATCHMLSIRSHIGLLKLSVNREGHIMLLRFRTQDGFNHYFFLRFRKRFPISLLALATRPDLSETAGTLFGGFKFASKRRDS